MATFRKLNIYQSVSLILVFSVPYIFRPLLSIKFPVKFNWKRNLSSLPSNLLSSHSQTRDPKTFYKYISFLQRSNLKTHLYQIHAQIYAAGLQYNGFLITKFIHVSSDIGEISYARKVFDEFPYPYVFLWNAIIRGYSSHYLLDEAIQMYNAMQQACVRPDCFTFPHVFKACSGLLAARFGKAVHGQVFRLGLESDLFIQNGVVTLYAKCSKIELARTVFDRLNEKSIVSWTSLISGYVQNGKYMEALNVFSEMRGMDVEPDWIVLVSILKAYSDVEDLEQGRCVHGMVIKMGLELELDLRVALTSLYAKCGQVAVAKVLFEQLEAKDVILWNAMISGFAKSGYPDEAIVLFHKMVLRGISPDSVSIQSTILACANGGSLGQARWMDEYISKIMHKDDIYVNTALIDMYAKCGSVELAREVFDRSLIKDIVLWSAMIVGYGLHGRGTQAIDLFNKMINTEVRPNDVTFIGLLMACKHSGLVEEGWKFFHRIRDFGIEPRHQHYACVVDLLGRAGYVEKAYDFIQKMPIEPGESVWGSLLSACRVHCHVQLGEYAAEKLFSLDSLNTGHYVNLSNLYASARMWDGVAKVRVQMKANGLSKDLGYSTIEVKGKLHTFRMGDKCHTRSEDIYKELERLERRLMELGFSPDRESALHDLDGEDKELSLCNHSERLAIAYGLISTPQGETLRIIKNLRACLNCHEATKLISKLVDREIVVRDTNRFHHFKDGNCSCGDFW